MPLVLIDEAEWHLIAPASTQRAELLDRSLADIYGETIPWSRKGLLPGR
jgi:uncharacterized circularly permuted ATP-grasp superfamily protein